MNVSVIEVEGQPALSDRGDLGAADHHVDQPIPTGSGSGTDTDEEAWLPTDRITELARQEASGSDVQGMTECARRSFDPRHHAHGGCRLLS